MVGIPAHSAMVVGAAEPLKMLPPADAAEFQIVGRQFKPAAKALVCGTVVGRRGERATLLRLCPAVGADRSVHWDYGRGG